jgi:hypothetical protein
MLFLERKLNISIFRQSAGRRVRWDRHISAGRRLCENIENVQILAFRP